MDARGPKIPREPEEPFPAEWLPTPAAAAAEVLTDWIQRNPHDNAGGVRILRDREAVVVYWKGPPPAGLQSLAAKQAVPVSIQSAAYSLAELLPIAKMLVTNHHDVLVSAGPSKDYSGISVHLKPEALVAKLVAELSAEAEVPVVCDGVGDSGPTPYRQPSWHRLTTSPPKNRGLNPSSQGSPPGTPTG